MTDDCVEDHVEDPNYYCVVCGRPCPWQGPEHLVNAQGCKQCWELTGYNFKHSRTDPTPEEMAYYESLVAEAVAEGGDADKIRRSHEHIWKPVRLVWSR
jgi:hypothetical protein